MVNSLASGGQVGSGSLGSPPPKRRGGSKIDPNYGLRTVRYYPITEEELSNLFWLGVAVTFCFSSGLGLLAFILDVQREFSFTPNIPEKTKAFWNQFSVGAGVAACILFLVGIILFFRGHTKISRIKKETHFGQK